MTFALAKELTLEDGTTPVGRDGELYLLSVVRLGISVEVNTMTVPCWDGADGNIVALEIVDPGQPIVVVSYSQLIMIAAGVAIITVTAVAGAVGLNVIVTGDVQEHRRVVVTVEICVTEETIKGAD